MPQFPARNDPGICEGPVPDQDAINPPVAGRRRKTAMSDEIRAMTAAFASNKKPAP